ncbi:CatB-related O-acetyltransferase [Candidatus Merdisoma sp. JLR.KK006]|uniref:CatB-related O-acetyltransferase n=1 Tax=Candidatus Merdisoma sp. JLR.KK006 TaxID=3112626 RepID=UPI002FF2B9B1
MDIKYYIQKAFQKVLSQPIVRSSKISNKSAVWNDCLIIDSEIDDYTYVSDHTNIYYAKIGKFCSIASYCLIGGASHPIEYVSTSPVFLEGRNALKTHFANIPYKPYKETFIGNDVWIGAKCCIKGGVTIGDGAVIGMGSVLLKDVGAYEIWAGNPAHFIRKRFDDETISKLLEMKWWKLSKEDIAVIADNFNTPSLLLIKIDGEESG